MSKVLSLEPPFTEVDKSIQSTGVALDVRSMRASLSPYLFNQLENCSTGADPVLG